MKINHNRKFVILTGGVGGAKLVDGFAQVVPPQNLVAIANTGDDFEHFGLYISPDLDTVCYTLAGLSNPETGWGLKEETWTVLDAISNLGGPDWFHIGDKDLATHLERSRLLRQGMSLSEITGAFCRKWGVDVKVLPMSDDPLRTVVLTNEGELPFQEYFVKRGCEPVVYGFRFTGIKASQPAPGVIEAIRNADFVIFSPSNPWVSIDPILSIPQIMNALKRKAIIAVSPIIGGKTLKGPAAKMFSELGIEPSALSVAEHYGGLLKGFIIDEQDGDLKEVIEKKSVKVCCTNIIMRDRQDRGRLAAEIIYFCENLLNG